MSDRPSATHSEPPDIVVLTLKSVEQARQEITPAELSVITRRVENGAPVALLRDHSPVSVFGISSLRNEVVNQRLRPVNSLRKVRHLALFPKMLGGIFGRSPHHSMALLCHSRPASWSLAELKQYPRVSAVKQWSL